MPRSPEARHQLWTLVLASLGVFMVALDTLVVSTALPVLRVDFGAGLSDLEWTVNAYNLSFACFLLMGAALGDRYGRRRMFVVGLALFTGASAAAALSPDVGALVAARAVQGAGAAIVTPLTLTLITAAFPAPKRGMAVGLWGGISGLAVASGPIVGGAVIDGLSWHWIFWLNVPIGVALIPMAARRLTESFGPAMHLDVRGLLLAGAGFLGLTWGLVRANSIGWTSGEALLSLAAGAVLVGTFLAWERRAANPLVPLTLARRRGVLTANGVSFCTFGALFGAVFLMSQFLQTALGNSPFQAGLRILPWTAMPVLVAPIAGTLADRYGNRPFMVVGLALQAIGLGWVAAIARPGMPYLELGAALTVAGIGTSMCFPTVASAVVGAVPAAQVGVVSGVNSAVRQLGGVCGVAVLAAVFGRHGYSSPQAFTDRFSLALWVAVAMSAAGVVPALLAPRRAQPAEIPAVIQPALAS